MELSAKHERKARRPGKSFLERQRIMRKLREARLSPSFREQAMRIMRSRTIDPRRLPSQRFLDRHPDKGVSDEEIILMKALQQAGFPFREIEIALQVRKTNGMAAYRAIRDRYRKAAKSKGFVALGSRKRRTAARTGTKPAIHRATPVAVHIPVATPEASVVVETPVAPPQPVAAPEASAVVETPVTVAAPTPVNQPETGLACGVINLE